MRWADAIRLNPAIARLLLADEKTARAMSLKVRNAHLKASGLIKHDSMQEVRDYMAQLREYHTGKKHRHELHG